MGFVKEQVAGTLLFSVPAFSATGLVKHGFTCRLGGISEGSFSSFNLGLHVGDNPPFVLSNREKLAGIFGVSIDRLVAADQVHGKQVYQVTASDAGRGSESLASAIPQTDALITNVPGILLSLYYADCVPLFFLDPENRAAGLAHAGWKGTMQKIAAETLAEMTRCFGTKPAACLAAVGPAVGACCYRVGPQVFHEFTSKLEFSKDFFTAWEENRWQLDLPGLNREQLIREGISPCNITMSNLCTSCHVDLFYSYRREQGITGRQASLIMLRKEKS